MRTSVFLKFRLGLFLSGVSGTGRLIRAARRGAPFVADLRVRWSQLQAVESGPGELEVYQLLGTIDDLVTDRDQTDLFQTEGFTFIRVVETNHSQILELDSSTFGQRRRQTFEDTLTEPRATLLARYGIEHDRIHAAQKRATEEHVVFILHGIRDSGRWMKLLADSFLRQEPSLAVKTPKYAYFPMGAFLLLGKRQKNVRWFMDRYSEEIANSPRGQFSVVGHSNRTYILARALDRYGSLNVHRVVFAGSVVPRAFAWSRWIKLGRVTAVQNYTAAGDWVVAIFPRLFELIGEITPFTSVGDIGSGGFNGFQDPGANRHEYMVKGAHSGALVPENHANIIQFIASGQSVPPVEAVFAKDPVARVDLLSRLCWLVWIVLIAAVIGLGVGAAALGEALHAPAGVAVALYVALLWLILETI